MVANKFQKLVLNQVEVAPFFCGGVHLYWKGFQFIIQYFDKTARPKLFIAVKSTKHADPDPSHDHLENQFPAFCDDCWLASA